MFITFEGPDGSGKTTQIKILAEKLHAAGYDVLITREPGGTEISDQIRSVIMNLKNKSMSPRAEILLFCAARAQLVQEVIRPALLQGKIVISDRYGDSTLAYQGYGHGLEIATLQNILDFVTGGLHPDLTILLDIASEIGLQRRQNGCEEWNRLDDYDLAFHRRVRTGYSHLAEAEPLRWQTLDASKSIDALQADVYELVMKRIMSNAEE